MYVNAERLRKVLSDKNVTEAQLTLAGLTLKQVQNMLNGGNTYWKTLIRIADFLEVDLGEIIKRPLTIGNCIKLQMYRKGMDILQLSHASGVSEMDIAKIIEHDHLPSLWAGYEMAKALGCTVDELLGFNQDGGQNTRPGISGAIDIDD